MKINIIGGSGTMGNLHKNIFEKAGYQVIISGRNSTISIEEASKNSDITIISVPIKATEKVIQKVAPFCTAIMDFTGLKVFPINAMLKYSNKDCEVAGLHPLYGNVESIANRTIIFCKTERTGKKCEEIIYCLENAKAKIKTMSPEEHDFKVGGIAQNAKNILLESYAKLLMDNGIKIKDFYEICPPPSRIILSLLARQSLESNDELYKQMLDKNPFTQKIKNDLKNNIDEKTNTEEIRKIFGEKLESLQKKAAKITEEDTFD